jgi:transposase-like protein
LLQPVSLCRTSGHRAATTTSRSSRSPAPTSSTQGSFVEGELGALAGDDDDALRLAATLRVYLEEHASPRRTAQRLGIHENTVKNRIRAAQELLLRPLDSNVPEVLVALRLARAVSDRSLTASVHIVNLDLHGIAAVSSPEHGDHPAIARAMTTRWISLVPS